MTTTTTARVLVTGASGFIGSHVVLELLDSGYSVFALGNANDSPDQCGLPPNLKNVLHLSTGGDLRFGRCDLLLPDSVDELFRRESFSVVIHLASLKGVADSVANPLDFYVGNLKGALNLLTACRRHKVEDLIFASSATVYGVPSEIPILEDSVVGQQVTNPYGHSKYMIETMIRDACAEKSEWTDLRAVILRIFDPAGAHPSGLIGEPGPPKHLMPFISLVALGKYPHLSIYGDHFPTVDGTGVRDFVHIMDVARAHVLALRRLKEMREQRAEPRVEIYNLGLGRGHSVLEMAREFEKASGREVNYCRGGAARNEAWNRECQLQVPVKICAPRVGDIAAIYCDPTAARKRLKWVPQYGIGEICRDLWNYQKRTHAENASEDGRNFG